MDPDAWNRDVTRASLTLALVWVYLTLYLLAFLVAFPAAVRRAHRLRAAPALLVGWAGFLVYQGILLVFLR